MLSVSCSVAFKPCTLRCARHIVDADAGALICSQAAQQVQEAAAAAAEEEPGSLQRLRLRRRMLGMQSRHAAHGCMQSIQPEAMRLQVSDIAEVYHLSKLPDLQILSLSDNPVTADEDYRAKVIIKFAQENNSQGIRSCRAVLWSAITALLSLPARHSS